MGNCRWKADSSAEFCGFFEPQICPFPWMRFAASRFLRAAILSCSTRFATRIGTVALTVIFLPLIEKRRRRGAILFLSLDKSPATPGSVRPTGREFQRIDFVDADDWLTSTFTERSTPAFCPLSDKAASARSQQCPTGLRDGFPFCRFLIGKCVRQRVNIRDPIVHRVFQERFEFCEVAYFQG